jgi:hypothetical protein
MSEFSACSICYESPRCPSCSEMIPESPEIGPMTGEPTCGNCDEVLVTVYEVDEDEPICEKCAEMLASGDDPMSDDV